MVIFGEHFEPRDTLAKFQAQPARTDDDCAELLKAVAYLYASDGESKWSRMSEEYNTRAAEKKSKPWIKRAAGKIDVPTFYAQGMRVSAGDDEAEGGYNGASTGRQKKKQDKVMDLRKQASEAVAADMPDTADAQATFVSRKTVEHFWDSLTAGELPELAVEGIFGCKTGDKTGEAVYGAWGVLMQRKQITQEDMVQALCNGQLPTAFGRWLQDVPAKERTPDVSSLIKDEASFRKIPWVVAGLKRCARPDREVAVSVSIGTPLNIPMIQEVEPEEIRTAAFPSDAKKMSTEELLGQLREASGKDGGNMLDMETIARGLQEKHMGAAAKKKEEVEVKGGSGDGYTWSQQNDEVEVIIPVADSVGKKDVKIAFKNRELVVEAPKSIRLNLHAPILGDGCGWTLGKGQIVVTMEKKEPCKWPALLAAK